MMKKIITALTITLGAASFGASAEHAPDFSFFDSEYAASKFLEMDTEERQEKARKSDRIDNLKLLSSLHHYIDSVGDYNYEKAEKSVMDAFISAYPDFKGYWDNEYDFEGKYVLQRDSAIDLEATNFFDAPNYINKHAMKYGISPVGTDGQKIKLCLMSQNSASSWFEVLNSDIKPLEKALYGNTEFNLLCVSEIHLDGYWTSRLEQFQNERYEYTGRYHYDKGE